MSKSKEYKPEYGYKYQILTQYKANKSYEHCDYARDKVEKNYLLNEYKLAYNNDFKFIVYLLPKKYWKEAEKIK